MATRVAALALTAVIVAGCGSSSSGGSGGSGGGGGGSGGALTDESTCFDWNAATVAQRKAYTQPLQAKAQLNVYNFLRDTCEPVTQKESAQAIVLGPTVSSLLPSP
jgi:hypothetical protein